MEWAIVLLVGGALVYGWLQVQGSYRRFYSALLYSLLFMTLFEGGRRDRVRAVDLVHYFSPVDPFHRTKVPFFRHMRMGPDGAMLVEFLAKLPAADRQHTLYGPRLEFAYAMLGVPSPKGLPIYWQPGTAYARTQEAVLFQRLQDQQFQTVIFLRGSFDPYPLNLYPLAMHSYLEGHYKVDQSNSYFDVWRRKPTAIDPN